ncbi:MAG: hypothetical protein ACD_69C00267G0004 [uncultured bacterium]|nr:MAG: hypothetical protein ACD_69C00267G0004 [uncultured bacterium]
MQINAPFIEEYVCFKDIIYSIYKNFILIFGCNKKIFFIDHDYSCLVSDHMRKEFFMGSFVNSLLLYRAFKGFFDSLPSIEEYTIVYPFENQPWEKGLLKAAREQTKKINLFAYQFFPLARNLALHSFSKYAKKTNMIPDKILTSDINTNNIFVEQGTETVLIGSGRFGNLVETSMRLKKRDKNKILCCLFLDPQEAFTLTYKAIEISRNLGCLLVINYHALLSKKIISEIKTIVEKYQHVSVVEAVASELLEDIFVVLYNSSSVCFEAALRGVPVLYVACENLLNLDRFNGLSKGIAHIKEGVFFIRSLIENEELYENYSYDIYTAAKNIILPLNFTRMREALQKPFLLINNGG